MTQDGIYVAAANSVVYVTNAVLRENQFAGFRADAGLEAVLDGVHAEANADVGVLADSGAKVTVTASVISRSFFGAQAASGGQTSDLMITRSTLTGNEFSFVVASTAGSERLVSDGNAINDSFSEAFHYAIGLGTEIIYAAGNNTVGFNNSIQNGPLTPIGTH
jgi:hypothetical protein